MYDGAPPAVPKSAPQSAPKSVPKRCGTIKLPIQAGPARKCSPPAANSHETGAPSQGWPRSPGRHLEPSLGRAHGSDAR
eukprot:5637566-Pyramimonas_sp.AAC.1